MNNEPTCDYCSQEAVGYCGDCGQRYLCIDHGPLCQDCAFKDHVEVEAVG